MDGGDELYSVKNLFWLGNYADAISEARSLRLKEGPARAERDIIVLRALCGQGNYACVRCWKHCCCSAAASAAALSPMRYCVCVP